MKNIFACSFITSLATLAAGQISYSFPAATCGTTGGLTTEFLIGKHSGMTLQSCINACYAVTTCASFSLQTKTGGCHLYSGSMAIMGFVAKKSRTAFYDKGCFSRVAGPFTLEATRTGDSNTTGTMAESGSDIHSDIAFTAGGGTVYFLDGTNLLEPNGLIYAMRPGDGEQGEFDPGAYISKNVMAPFACGISKTDTFLCTVPNYPDATFQIQLIGGQTFYPLLFSSQTVGEPTVLKVAAPNSV